MLRAREDRALEVWVGRGRKLAGWLTSSLNTPMNMLGVVVTIARLDDAGDLIEESRGFDLTAVRKNFDTDDLIWKELKTGNDVPLYAVRTHIDAGKTTQFAWRVLRLEQNDYDWLFDHPNFVPVDTVDDRDFRATEEGMTEYLREAFEEELTQTLQAGSAAAYRASSTNVASATSVESAGSAMTVETLRKAMNLLHSQI
jgi:hypothetical protein